MINYAVIIASNGHVLVANACNYTDATQFRRSLKNVKTGSDFKGAEIAKSKKLSIKF